VYHNVIGDDKRDGLRNTTPHG